MQQMLTIIDDDSIVSQVVQTRLKEAGFAIELCPLAQWQPKESQPPCPIPDLITWAAIDLAYETDRAVVFPDATYRIWNANYYRSLKREYGEPYFVLIEIEERQAAQEWAKSQGYKIFWHLEDLIGSWNQEILTHPLMLEWLCRKSCPEPHNDRIERLIFADWLRQRAIAPRDLYATVELSERQLNLATQLTQPEQVIRRKHYPMHSYFKQFFGQELQVNGRERELYGDLY